MNSEHYPLLSVVIIGRNEGARLVRCIESVHGMTLRHGLQRELAIDIIYVDSDSTDGSAARARELGANVIQVKPERPSAALGRNAGWRVARGEFVLFLDGDTILDRDFVMNAIPGFDDPLVAVVFGHRREINPKRSLYNRVLDLDWVSPCGVADYCGGDALIRRSVLEEAAGYDETLIAGEEPEMCRRFRAQGYVVLHVDLPMTGHDLAITRWPQYWRRAYRTGHAYAEVAERFRGTNMPLWDSEVRRNLKRGAVLLALPLLGIAASLALWSLIPFLAVVAFLALLVIRTSIKVAWKSPDKSTIFLYGIHSHLQQIPILFGQLAYRRARRSGRRQRLIEYKETVR
jgi:glycosyltransferase involved in cell wall biosynthesis